jgi:protease II
LKGLLYEEKDTTYSVSLEKSRTDRFLFISVSSTMSDEWLYLPSDQPTVERMDSLR